MEKDLAATEISRQNIFNNPMDLPYNHFFLNSIHFPRGCPTF